jgi:hypothetical protein
MGVVVCIAGLATSLAVAEPQLRVAPKMRYFTLEDLYGDTGDTFQAAFGMETREQRPGGTEAQGSYGYAVDDVLIEWREFRLIPDETDCAVEATGGNCAVLDVASSQFFEGNAILAVTVLENSQANDCDFDNVIDSPPFDTDCDDDGTPDVPVKISSPQEPAGEILLLDRTSSPCDCEYKSDIPVSSTYNVDGVIFIQQQGTVAPFVLVQYNDLNDGTGEICKNDVSLEAQGKIFGGTTVRLVAGSLLVQGKVIKDDQDPAAGTHGDGDGSPDTNETVQMRISVKNATGVPLQNIFASLATNDSVNVDCIKQSQISIGDIGVDEVVWSEEGFLFRVSNNVQRTDPLEILQTEFTVILGARGDDLVVESSTAAQKVTVDLDLDFSGGSGPTIWSEGFETPGTETPPLAKFIADNLDEDLHSLAAANGYRCQYNDPDWEQSNSYGDENCFPASSVASAQAFYWQINTPASPDGGRAFDGSNSLYMGIYGPASDENTSPVGTLEGIKTADPIYIGWDKICSESRNVPCDTDTNCAGETPPGQSCVQPTPKLSFRHIVSLMDSGYSGYHGCISSRQGRSSDKGVVAVQLADTDVDETPVGPWKKMDSEIISNGYDQVSEDNYVSCFFDPIDDGNTEDTYCYPEGHANYDPTCIGDLFDFAFRRHGPSSTCAPGFSWSALGDSDNPFNPNNVWNGDPGSGLEGSRGLGTWVESVVDLEQYKGRRIRLRFLTTGLKAAGGTAETWEIAFSPLNPQACDDGWWIDDIEVTDALTEPATVDADTAPNTDSVLFPGCGPDCVAPVAALEADPPATTPLPAPGQAVGLDASGSTLTSCLDGTLQYRFCVDGDANDSCGDPADTLLRGYTDNPLYVDAPAFTSRYLVEVRCSSFPTAPACRGAQSLLVTVICPSTGTQSVDFPSIFATGKTALEWLGPQTYNHGTGLLSDVSTYTTTSSGIGQGPAVSHPLGGNPPVDVGYWWLFRVSGGGDKCNATNTYGNLARDAAPGLP